MKIACAQYQQLMHMYQYMFLEEFLTTEGTSSSLSVIGIGKGINRLNETLNKEKINDF